MHFLRCPAYLARLVKYHWTSSLGLLHRFYLRADDHNCDCRQQRWQDHPFSWSHLWNSLGHSICSWSRVLCGDKSYCSAQLVLRGREWRVKRYQVFSLLNKSPCVVGTTLAAIISLLVVSGNTKVSTKDAFTLFENNSGWMNSEGSSVVKFDLI